MEREKIKGISKIPEKVGVSFNFSVVPSDLLSKLYKLRQDHQINLNSLAKLTKKVSNVKERMIL